MAHQQKLKHKALLIKKQRDAAEANRNKTAIQLRAEELTSKKEEPYKSVLTQIKDLGSIESLGVMENHHVVFERAIVTPDYLPMEFSFDDEIPDDWHVQEAHVFFTLEPALNQIPINKGEFIKAYDSLSHAGKALLNAISELKPAGLKLEQDRADLPLLHWKIEYRDAAIVKMSRFAPTRYGNKEQNKMKFSPKPGMPIMLVSPQIGIVENTRAKVGKAVTVRYDIDPSAKADFESYMNTSGKSGSGLFTLSAIHTGSGSNPTVTAARQKTGSIVYMTPVQRNIYVHVLPNRSVLECIKTFESTFWQGLADKNQGMIDAYSKRQGRMHIDVTTKEIGTIYSLEQLASR